MVPLWVNARTMQKHQATLLLLCYTKAYCAPALGGERSSQLTLAWFSGERHFQRQRLVVQSDFSRGNCWSLVAWNAGHSLPTVFVSDTPYLKYGSEDLTETTSEVAIYSDSDTTNMPGACNVHYGDPT